MMNIEEFLNNFNDIIFYKFTLKIGGSRANSIITNNELISSKNRKGKLYPFYKKNLSGTTTDYVLIQELDIPIELTIECSHSHILKWEKEPKSTNKTITNFQVRLLNEDKSRQIGYLSLDLTPAGDIEHKYCSFYNDEGTHMITQSIFYDYDDETKKVIPRENLSFTLYDLENRIEEKLTFHKEDGNLKCVTINKQGLKNHAYDSIVWSEDEVKEKNEFFSRFCNGSKLEHATPLACDMTNYIINNDFTYKLERLKELQTILSYGNKILNSCDKIIEEIEYLNNPKNDCFSGFYGEYIGNTIIKLDSKLTLIVETLEDEYHYFTSVDITGTDAFDIDFYHERVNGKTYYQAIENSNKIPMFRTKIVNGEEVLVPLGEHITDDEIRNFEQFKSYYTESFSTIESKKMATLSPDKYSKRGQNRQLVKNSKENKGKK